MMLTELRLKNVKSYRDATIEFKPGINGITGENGHGKTTILEAIGYALFDYLPYPERNFIRHDTQSGSVELDFLSDDEIIYTITRKIGGSDIKLSTPIGKITGKKDVMDWLIDNLFPFAGDQRGLRSIFENAVGVPQGSFTTAFAQTPAVRRSIFDGVLGVDEYKKAYQNLLPVLNSLKDGITELEKEVLVLRTETQEYEELKWEKSELERDITSLLKEIQEIKSRIELLGAERDELARREEKIQQIEKELHKLKVLIETTEKDLKRVKNDLEEAESAENIVNELADKKKEYEENEQKLKDLYARREERNRCEKKALSLKNNIAILKEREKKCEELEKEILGLKREKEDLQPVVKEYKALQRETKLIQEELKEPLRELIFEKKSLEEVEKLVNELNNRLNKLKKEKNQLLPQLDRQNYLNKEIEEKIRSIGVIHSEVTELERRSEQTCEENLCPILHGIRCEAVTDFNTYFTEEISKREEKLKIVQKKLSELQRELESLKDPAGQISERETLIKEIEKQLKSDRLRSIPEKNNENKTKIYKLREKFKKYTTELTGNKNELKKIEEILIKLNKQIETLEDAKIRLYTIEKLTHTKREELEKLKETKEEKRRAEEELEKEKKKLSKYAGLNETIRIIENRTEKLRDAHNTYLQNSPIAARKPELISVQKKNQIKLEEEETKTKKLKEERQKEETHFNKTKLHELGSRLETLGKRLSARESTQVEKEKQFKTTEKKLEKTKTKLKELEKIEKQLKQEEKLHTYTTYIRDLLNNSGQLIIHQLIDQIATEATNTYCEIMQNYTTELHWNEDYEITLTENGQEHSYTQLSGGEQMSAALAIRLAILKTTSQIDIIFLDEPTTNLDTQRRENLARQLQNIHNFKQLIIITHDNTLSEQTNHTIHITKTNSESRATP